MTRDATVIEVIAYDCGFRAGQSHAAGLLAALEAVLAVADAPAPPMKNPTSPADWARTSAMHIGVQMLDVFPQVRAAIAAAKGA